MSKVLPKKGMERRKRDRGKGADPHSKGRRRTKNGIKDDSENLAAEARQNIQKHPDEVCHYCAKDLSAQKRSLFVEEEVGRIFCSEACIESFFAPEIDRIEKDYFQHLPADDLSTEEREEYSHLRWLTLEEPDEVWREKMPAGDFRYYLISEFTPDERPVWVVCICLFLRGEPSFLYFAFPTRSSEIADRYRRGERIEWQRPERSGIRGGGGEEAKPRSPVLIDCLADSWTEDESMRAEVCQNRRQDDIRPEDFDAYRKCFEETLQAPDEVWVQASKEGMAPRSFHFIRYYPEERTGFWYVIVARETDDEEQIEILDVFPSRDPELINRYRRGERKLGSSQTPPSGRLVH